MRDLELQIRSCTNCDLYLVGNGPVPWRGVRSDIFILGEAPGRQENERGVPFVGPAGELLWRQLEQVGISQHTVFTANTVCCWPDGTPTEQHVSACNVNLWDQVKYCDPLWVLALGRVANQALGCDESMGTSHGQWYAVYPFPETVLQVFPTYHPSAILRNQTLTRSWRHDLKEFARVTLGYGYEEGPTV